MSTDLRALVDPSTTVLVTQECQNGVIGDEAIFPALAEAARATGLAGNIGRLTKAARFAGVRVIHCLALRRGDDAGANTNARLFGAARKAPVKLLPGTRAAELVPEIGVDDADLVLTRLHGLGPMAGTDLDPILRNLGATTIVGVGVSVNVGMTNFVMDAVNAGYRFVLPRDAVAGVPPGYAEAIVDNTLALLASVVTTEDVVAAWGG
ncbi:MAG: cysteine hydrolase [Actinobacteria bacterium]|nr:cysteine hydrolase [Actinomycetota bacterium]